MRRVGRRGRVRLTAAGARRCAADGGSGLGAVGGGDAFTAGRMTGSASILVLAALLVVMVTGALAVSLAAVASARERAAAAADLAALAGAGSVGTDVGPCSAAARVAALDHGRLTTCAVSGSVVEVVVAVALPPALAVLGPVAARARAGPADASGGKRSPRRR